MIRFDCRAKINLFLDISGKDPSDGYHYIESIFQEVSLSDTVEMNVRGKSGSDNVVFDDSEWGMQDEGIRQGLRDSTVHRALKAFRDGTGIEDRFEVRVVKRIPAGAGLGGGSSDAGGILFQLGGLYGVETPELHRIAASVGSDVPFFLYGGACRVSGKGEAIQPLPAKIEAVRLLIVYPGFPVSTKWAYSVVTEYGNGEMIRNFTEKSVYNIDFLAENVYNRFQRFIMEREVKLESILRSVEAQSRSRFAVMSGSGSSLVFGYESEEEARYGMEFVNRNSLGKAFLVTPVYRESGSSSF